MNVIEIVIVVFLGILVILGVVGGYLFWKKKYHQNGLIATQNLDNSGNNPINTEFIQMKTQLEELRKDLVNRAQVQDQDFKNSVSQLSQVLTKIDENKDKVQSLDKSIGMLKDDRFVKINENQLNAVNELKNLIKNVQTVNDGIIDLNNIFYNTKRRGNLGEFSLEILLTDILGNNPKVWERQFKLYTFENNVFKEGRVDFVVHTNNHGEDIIIDSKFPLENYKELQKAIEEKRNVANINHLKDEFKKDIKQKIQEVRKYINKKNNINSIILFIPSERIFNFIGDEFSDVVNDAIKKKVWITAPTGLASLLNIINAYLKDFELNNNLTKIKAQILKLIPLYQNFSDRWTKLNKETDDLVKAIKDFNTTVKKVERQQNLISEFEIEEEQVE